MDIRAALKEPLLINPGQIVLVPTGFAVAIPAGYEIQVRPRSGLAIKHGVTVVNAPGTIDADYRGEVMVGLINLGHLPFTISRYDRIGTPTFKLPANVPAIQAAESIFDKYII